MDARMSAAGPLDGNGAEAQGHPLHRGATRPVERGHVGAVKLVVLAWHHRLSSAAFGRMTPPGPRLCGGVVLRARCRGDRFCRRWSASNTAMLGKRTADVDT
jgi:hypothetical protein